LRHFEILNEHFPHVTLVETELQCSRIRSAVPKRKGIRLLSTEAFASDARKYDAIFLISVLHIIPMPSTRREIIQLARSKLKKGGYLITDIPTGEAYYRHRCTKQNEYSDGWVMGTGNVKTFYKNFSARAADRLIASVDSFTLSSKVSVDHHIVRIWRAE
jgi:hypothetical protein